MKQKKANRHRKQIYSYHRETVWGWDKLGVWELQIQTTIYKIDKQQGQVPTV